MDLVSMSEIAERAGVAKITVRKWRERNLGFPEPLKTLTIGPVWEWTKVEKWLRATGRMKRCSGDGSQRRMRT